MTSHILIDRAHQFPVPCEPPIVGWTYRRDIGAWVLADKPDRLMVSRPRDSRSQPYPQPPISKKRDIETGEDMKGE